MDRILFPPNISPVEEKRFLRALISYPHSIPPRKMRLEKEKIFF